MALSYSSSWSPWIKITRAVLYTLLFLASLGLIASSLHIGLVKGQPKYHPGKVITLAADQHYLGARATAGSPSGLTSIVFPLPTTRVKTHNPKRTTTVRASSTGGVKTSHSSHKSKPTSTPVSASASSSASSSSSSSSSPEIPKSSWSATPTHGGPHRPHPSSFPEPGGYYTYCSTNKARLLYITIAGAVSSTLVLSLLFIFPTSFGSFLSQFWFELVVVEVLLVAWTVVAFLATKEATVLRECTREVWRKPALLAFAWAGWTLNFLAMVGLLALALIEKSRGNDHIWKAKLNTYIFGEDGAIRLGEDSEGRAIVPGGH